MGWVETVRFVHPDLSLFNCDDVPLSRELCTYRSRCTLLTLCAVLEELSSLLANDWIASWIPPRLAATDKNRTKIDGDYEAYLSNSSPERRIQAIIIYGAKLRVNGRSYKTK
jgi:hypothetical protein